jgi:hypothetical protein
MKGAPPGAFFVLFWNAAPKPCPNRELDENKRIHPQFRCHSFPFRELVKAKFHLFPAIIGASPSFAVACL